MKTLKFQCHGRSTYTHNPSQMEPGPPGVIGFHPAASNSQTHWDGRKWEQMADYTSQTPLLIRSFFVFLQTIILLPGIVWALDSLTNSCPLSTHHYKAELKDAYLTATVGETVILNFSLDPTVPPQGFFLSVNMDTLQEPEAAKDSHPDILTGFPETSILFHTPGVYRYRGGGLAHCKIQLRWS